MGDPVSLPPGFVQDGPPSGFVLDSQTEKPSAASRFASNAWEGANPVSLLSGMGESILHPLQAIKGYLKQNSDLADKVEAALKRGDHGQALKHFGDLALQVIPGLGAQSDAAGEQISDGDVAGGLGKSTGAALGVVEASALPKIARGAAEAIHAVPGAAATVGRVVTNPEVIRKGVKVLPKGGAMIEAYDAIKKAAAQPAQPTATPQPETPSPGQPSAEMLRRAGIPLSAEEQALAQHIMEGVEPEQGDAIPNPEVSANSPDIPANPTPIGGAYSESIPPAADFESIPPQGPAQGNVIPIRPPGSPVQPGISLPGGQGAAIPPEVPGLDAQRAFAEAMTGDPSGGQIPAPASPHPPAEAFEAAYRAKRAQVLADHFHQNGISYEDLQHLTPGDLSSEQWEALLGKDPDTGVQFREPSQETIDQARVFLAGKSAAARSPKALAAAKELAGVGPKGSDVAPKAESAATPPSDYARAMEIERRYGLSAAEAAVINRAIDSAPREGFTSAAEAVQKEATRSALKSGVSLARVSDIKTLRKILEDYPNLENEPAPAPSTPEPKPKARAKAKTKKISDLMNDTGGK